MCNKLRYFAATVLLNLVLAVCPTGVQAQAQELDLESFVSLVEANSKDLQLAGKDREAAEAQKREAVGLALPQISGQAGYTRNLKDTYMYIDLSSLTGTPGVAKADANRDNEFSMGVSLRQTLFSGTVFNAISAARQYQRLTDFTYDATHQSILTAARKAFSYALLLQEVVVVTEQSEQNALENYEDMQKRYDNGLASEFELLQAESRYRERVPTTAAARRNLTLALIDLKNLAGIPVDRPLNLKGSLDEYPPAPDSLNLESILDERPDYNARLWEEQLRKTDVKAQKWGLFPSLSAVAAYGYSAQSNEFALDEENNSLTVGVQLSVPIFQGGQTRAKIKQAKVQLDKTRLEVSRLRDQIERDVCSVRLRLQEAHVRIASAQATLHATRKAFSIAEQTSDVGLTTQLELKDARIALDQATVNYYSAIFDYLSAYYDWNQVIGRVPGSSIAERSTR